MKQTTINFIEFIQSTRAYILQFGQGAHACEIYNIYEETEGFSDYLDQLAVLVGNEDLEINYISQFKKDLEECLSHIPFKEERGLNFLKYNIETHKGAYILSFEFIKKAILQLQFNVDFFSRLKFLKSHIVVIGANGSGKTSLADKLKYYTKNAVVISAQRILIIPTFGGISNTINTNKKLTSSQESKKNTKITYRTNEKASLTPILAEFGSEFSILLDNLIAERNSAIHQHYNLLKNNTGEALELPFSRLDRAIQIWNSLLVHKKLECLDGINLILQTNNSDNYPAHQMSDGEKAMLYLTSHVLQAPNNGFIIIDEPEIHLHKTVLKKLWDLLEYEREDCIFIYLTHDLDFATSRTSANKIWIKSFHFPDKWEMQHVTENELPESLLLELLGSRKDILFCEGMKGSIDEQIFNLLFPHIIITPVGGCSSVINYTKSFNEINNLDVRALGLIDSDHHDNERLGALNRKKIFSFSMAETENLFFDREFLELFAEQYLSDVNIVNLIIKEIIDLFKRDLDLQISNYISIKIQSYFQGSHFTKGNNFEDLNNSYENFLKNIKIKTWYEERRAELEKAILEKDYEFIIAKYNNKGLKKIVERNFALSDYRTKALKFLQKNPKACEALKKYFPSELVSN